MLGYIYYDSVFSILHIKFCIILNVPFLHFRGRKTRKLKMIYQVARHCPQHFLLSLWRRKSFLLGFVMVTSVFIICLQFGSNGSNGHLVSNGLPNEKGRDEYPMGLMGISGGHKTLIPRRNLSALNQRQDQNMFAPGQLVDMSGKPPR